MSPGSTTTDTRNRRVLIVEDEPLLAFALEEMLVESGFAIAGVASRLETALAIIESGVCDAAILDTNLAGTSVDPAASALAARGLPFIILSGYSPDEKHGAFFGALRLQKPCRSDRLIHAMRSILPAP